MISRKFHQSMESMRLRMLSKYYDDNIYLKDSNKMDKDLLDYTKFTNIFDKFVIDRKD
ncbi:hypothetical protein SAC12B_0055 [Lactobacillus phage SAC12B]|uniref:Uncharacterized protein n=1 Tax=Lactobacillus phage SAC12B TaxID=2510941 RepID=A0A4Y5FIC9_9CAUD|nr:hypothetical protein HWC10_gp055 [Lactobacillus phage SAC12B]QBJ03844.1 hypothetical protein SAC12B_0055 [Lactobacillus phage SAC12B]